MPRTPAKQAISTLPPRNVANAAARGLRLREQHGRGGTAIGVARARDLSAQTSLSTQTIRRMHAYFARHSVDKNAKGWADRSAPSAGYIAWLLWGGDAGQRWATRLYQRLQDAASAKTKAGKGTGTSSTAAAGASDTTTRSAGKTAAQRTARKTAARKAARKTANKTTRTPAAKKPSARKGAARTAVAGSAVTPKPRSSSGARKTNGTTAARKTAVKKTAAKKAAARKTAARKTAVRKATAKKTPAKKTATKKTATKKPAARRPAASKSAATRSTAKKSQGKASAPWNKPNPKRASRSSPLSPAQKTQARRRAKAAGRPYPNLVDNMAVARKGSAAKRAGGAGAAKKAGKG